MNIKIPQNFPALLKKKRKELGYNQKEFGELLGVSQANISGYETGKYLPTKSVFLHIINKYPNILADNGSMEKTVWPEPSTCALDEENNKLVEMTRTILESGTHWSKSLKSNIESLYIGLMSSEYDRRKADQPEKIPKETGDRRKKTG